MLSALRTLLGVGCDRRPDVTRLGCAARGRGLFCYTIGQGYNISKKVPGS